MPDLFAEPGQPEVAEAAPSNQTELFSTNQSELPAWLNEPPVDLPDNKPLRQPTGDLLALRGQHSFSLEELAAKSSLKENSAADFELPAFLSEPLVSPELAGRNQQDEPLFADDTDASVQDGLPEVQALFHYTARPDATAEHSTGQFQVSPATGLFAEQAETEPVQPGSETGDTTADFWQQATLSPALTNKSGQDELPGWLNSMSPGKEDQPVVETEPVENLSPARTRYTSITGSLNPVEATPVPVPDWLQPDPVLAASPDPDGEDEISPRIPDWLETSPDEPAGTEVEQDEPGLAAEDGLTDNAIFDITSGQAPASSLPEILTARPSPDWLDDVSEPLNDYEQTADQAVAGLPAWMQPAPDPQAGLADEAQPVPRVTLPPQLVSAAVLRALLVEPATGVRLTASKKNWLRFEADNVTRWILSALLVAVALSGLYGSQFASPPAPATQVITFYNQVDNLGPNSKILLVYDWEASRSGEMAPLARAVTRHIMYRRARLLTFSLNPYGPALAEELTDELAANPLYGNDSFYKYNATYLNLGWRSGGEAAVRSLFDRLGELHDYKNNRRAADLLVMQGLNSLKDFDMILVLAGDEGSVRTWVEQFGIQPGARLLFAVPAAVEPVARPYAQGRVVNGPPRPGEPQTNARALLAGLNQTAQYEGLLSANLNLPNSQHLNSGARLGAYSLAALLLIAVILAGNLVWLVRRPKG